MASYPQGLDQMFFGPIGGDFAVEQFGQALKSDKMANQKSLQDMMIQQQKLPLEMDQMRAQNRNINASAGKTELDNDFTRATQDPKIRAELSKFATEIDENELKRTMTRLQGDLMSPDPMKRQQATQMYKLSADLLKFKEQEALKHQNAMALQNLQNKGATDVANINAASRVEAVKARGPAGGKGFDPKNPQHLYAQYTHLANTTEDPAEAARYNQLANDQLKVMVELETLKAQAGKAGDPALDQMKRPVPTRGTPQVGALPNRMAPPNINDMANESAQPAPKPMSGKRISVMSPDGKRGTIPEEQLNDAISQGYKQVK